MPKAIKTRKSFFGVDNFPGVVFLGRDFLGAIFCFLFSHGDFFGNQIIVTSPPKIRGGGGRVLVFEICTKRGVMKNLLRNRGGSS